jgi:hypothetical protein
MYKTTASIVKDGIILFQGITVFIQESRGSWSGYSDLPPGAYPALGQPGQFTIRLADGRSGSILIGDAPLVSTAGGRLTFGGTGTLA